MDADTQRLVESLHDNPTMAVIAATGGGTQAISWLLNTPGASRTVLEGLVPYSPRSLSAVLGGEPYQAVSARTATRMARWAYERALNLRPDNVPVVGVACTAAIATDRSRRGAHRCHVAAWAPEGMLTYGLQLAKGLRDRPGEERVVSMLLLRGLADAFGVPFTLPLGLDVRERLELDRVEYKDPIKALLAGHVSSVTVHSGGGAEADQPGHGAVLSGSFHPLHDGHLSLAEVASTIVGVQVTFELSVTNVDKLPLTEEEVRRRATQFDGRSLVVTRALVFHEKARLFPGCTFVLGFDTALRLLDPRYYGGDEIEMLVALREIRGLGCRFLVAGRTEGGKFRTLDEIAIPRDLQDMFSQIPESAFRCDTSSTDLRLAAGAGKTI